MSSNTPSKNVSASLRDSGEVRLRETLRRCSPKTVDAAIRFQSTRDPELLEPIVIGVLVRFIEPECRTRLLNGNEDLHLVEDLGIDSLLMVEIIIVLEEVFCIKIANDDLVGLSTVRDVHQYIDQHARRIA